MSNFTQNAKNGFVAYCKWIRYYPTETERATELAMIAVDTRQDICNLSEMIRQLNDDERLAFQIDEFINEGGA